MKFWNISIRWNARDQMLLTVGDVRWHKQEMKKDSLCHAAITRRVSYKNVRLLGRDAPLTIN